IAEADAAKIELGQKVTISSGALSDVNYSGKVQEIGLEARTKTKNQGETTSVPVIISIQKNSQLRPGYNVDLKITTAILDKAVVVPFDSIIEKGGHSCVYLIQDDKAKLQRIQTGISDNSSIQVKSGVKKGDKVIVNPPKEVKDGSEVQEK
ncbi:MAG: efflux transporter, family, subunit, partial [Firmicutes bacterium]|nr:efflux transporter, family, subunit [Bacillota bacterium]